MAARRAIELGGSLRGILPSFLSFLFSKDRKRAVRKAGLTRNVRAEMVMKKCVKKCTLWGRLKIPQRPIKRVFPKFLSEATRKLIGRCLSFQTCWK